MKSPGLNYIGGRMEEQPKKLLQWHVAFYAGIQIELETEVEEIMVLCFPHCV